MALTNALLVRWRDGWAEVTDAASIAVHGRREGFLALGSAASLGEVQRVANAVLATKAQPQVATKAIVEPSGTADTPYQAFGVADYITVPDEAGALASMRVMGLTVTEDDMGEPTFVPELRSRRDESERLVQRWLKRMANGTLGGSVESATPYPAIMAAPPATSRPPIEAPVFSFDNLTLVTTGRWYPPSSTRVVRLTASLEVAGSTPTTLYLLRNGAQVQALTIPAGANLAAVACSVAYFGPERDWMQVQVTAVGTGAGKLDVQPGLG